MKRPKPKRRRDRSSGQSPYAKYSKAPYQYSAEYRAWHKRVKERKESVEPMRSAA